MRDIWGETAPGPQTRTKGTVAKGAVTDWCEIGAKAGKRMPELGMLPWDLRVRFRCLTWAGHLARKPHGDLCRSCIDWRNLRWWRQRQLWISLGARCFAHPGRLGTPRRWETLLETLQMRHQDAYEHSATWQSLAQDRRKWFDACTNFLGLTDSQIRMLLTS